MKLSISLDNEETGKVIRDTKILFFDLNPPQDTELSIITAGWELTAPDYDLRREKYPYHTMEFIESGFGFLTLNGTDYSIEPKTVLSYRAHQSCRIQTAKDSRLSKFWVSMVGTEVEAFFEGISSAQFPVLHLKDSRYMHELFQQLLDYAGRYDFETGYSTCRLVLKLILKRILNDSVGTQRKLSVAYTKFNECLEYMENNVADLKSVNELAERIQIDPSYLIRLFKKFNTESPYKRLIRLKTREAAEILLYSDKPICDVAEEMGFEDQFIFSKCFKRVYGVSPKHFRDQFDLTK